MSNNFQLDSAFFTAFDNFFKDSNLNSPKVGYRSKSIIDTFEKLQTFTYRDASSKEFNNE